MPLAISSPVSSVSLPWIAGNKSCSCICWWWCSWKQRLQGIFSNRLRGETWWSSSMPLFEKKDTVIVKFKCRKQKRSILINRKNLRNKSDVLTEQNFSGRLFVSENMFHENHQLSYKCRQLKNAVNIHSTWFWKNSVNVKLNERSQPTKIHHVIDTEKLLAVDNLDEFINTTFFNNLTDMIIFSSNLFSTFSSSRTLLNSNLHC